MAWAEAGRRAWLGAINAVFCVGTVATAHAGGFYSPYQSAEALGSAFAGASARTDSPSFFLFNPAAAAGFDALHTYIDLRGFAPQARIGVTRVLDPLGVPITFSGGSGNLARSALAPGSVTLIPLATGLTLGFGGSTPFATSVKTRMGWAGRFQLLDAKMIGLRETVALGWQATPWLSLGLGVQVERLDTRFTNAALIPVGPFAPVEANIRMKGASWQAGPTAGLMVTAREGTRIGLSWRSAMVHRVAGRVAASLAGLPVEASRYAVHLPQTLSLGLEQRLGSRLRLWGEVQWINWSQFKGFRIRFPSGRPDEVRPIHWRDTYLAAVGLGYALQPDTELTAGLSVESAAAINASGTTLSTDARQMTLGVGLSRSLPGGSKISLNYALVLVEPAKVQALSVQSGLLSGRLTGRLHTLGLGYSLRW